MGDPPACIRAKAIEVRAGQGDMAAVVVPGVGAAKGGVQIVLIGPTVERIRAAPRDYLDLAARPTVEVGRLVGGIDLDLFDAGHRNGNHGRRGLVVAGAVIGPDATGRVGGEARNVGVVVAAHVVGRVTAIHLEGVLVAGCTANVAIDVLPRFQNGQR